MNIESCMELFQKETKILLESEKVSISEAYGRIVSNDIFAECNVPSFPKSAMDGYAVNSKDVAEASKERPVIFEVCGELFAGDYKNIPYRAGTAVRVMTGSFVPEGYDCVIRQEDTDYGENSVQIFKDSKPFGNYCKIGEDVMCGDLIIPKGKQLGVYDTGVLASCGFSSVEVYKKIRVSVISTGTELATPGDKSISAGKIYASIGYMIEAAVKKQTSQVISLELCEDEPAVFCEKMKAAIEASDVIITTGGVSVGKKDFVPAALESLGCKTLFHHADIQPGTPTLGAVYKGKPVLCLSGNPFAAMANFELYYWTIAETLTGCKNFSFENRCEKAVLQKDYPKVNKHRRLVRAFEAGGKVELSTERHASSVISSMLECNCFIDVPAGKSLKAGETVDILKISI